jgi:hypothetical protein
LVLLEVLVGLIIRGYRLYAFQPDAWLVMAVIRLDESFLIVWSAFVRLNLLFAVVLWLAYRRPSRLRTTVQGVLVALLLVSCSLAVRQLADTSLPPPALVRVHPK